MTAVAAPSMATPSPIGEEYSPVMEGVSWKTYEQLRRELDEAGSKIRITYDRGRMVLTSPLPIHGKSSRLIGRLIEALADERDLPLSSYGNTTWRRKEIHRGVESDECYYIQRAEAMRGKTKINVKKDPPPDLAVEVEVTHHPLDKPSIYAALRVPELWRYDGETLATFVLKRSGDYARAKESLAFPGFEPAKLHRFLRMYPDSLDGEIVTAFRKWLRHR